MIALTKGRARFALIGDRFGVAADKVALLLPWSDLSDTEEWDVDPAKLREIKRENAEAARSCRKFWEGVAK